MPGITVVGLGPGDPGSVTREAWHVLEESPEVYLRTGQHPLAELLGGASRLHTFDAIYQSAPSFDEVYHQIVETLLARAREPQGVVYAVPGDPSVGEAAVAALRRRAAEERIPYRQVSGVSFVEPTLSLLGVDALEGVYLADAVEMAARHVPAHAPDQAVLVAQLHSKLMASDVKLVLLSQYPPEHRVALVQSAGTPAATLRWLPLEELDRASEFDAVTTLYLPPLPRPASLEAFQDVVARLRAPDGCPWDQEQTHQSLRRHVLEEAYEVLAALDKDDPEALREELGDLLLQIVLQAQIAFEGGEFRLSEVLGDVQEKIVRRHPHVFGDAKVSSVDEVLHRWEELKDAERPAGSSAGGLAGVSLDLPALSHAYEIQDRAARVGFDWPKVEGVLAKISEEIEEFRTAGGAAAKEREFGDLLFSLVNLSRWLAIDPESSLRGANARFRSRFAGMEERARASGRRLGDLQPEEWETLWDQVKAQAADEEQSE
ncbi:MAG: nucleoside triphosphate pyrophosphohydrolase [Anaerolineales bacterium]